MENEKNDTMSSDYPNLKEINDSKFLSEMFESIRQSENKKESLDV